MAPKPMSGEPDIAAGRLTAEDYKRNFSDLHPPLTRHEATVEADRCFFCYDAPCMIACPTSIDIPLFIREISTGNPDGAAKTIFAQNILGGMCARVCPTETLCEEACVRMEGEGKPVKIGILQRYATDHFMEAGETLYERAAETGKTVAVVGGGPAGLACAHALARNGHSVTVFEAREKLGGLDEYGIAAYKTVDDFARKEVDFVLSIGGVTIETGKALGRDIALADLRSKYDAVFLGIGLGGVNALRAEGEDLDGVHDAVDYIAELRQADDLSALPIGRRVVVIGGGMTAIDMAVQARHLGAEDVTIAYRRGAEQMGASGFEQELAQVNGVRILYWVKPNAVTGDDGHATGIELERTRLDGSRVVGTGETIHLPADMVFKAIGQTLVEGPLGGELKIDGGKIVVDDEGRTSLDGVWAGGDCVAGGEDLTVQAVAHGRDAAASIHRALGA
ncbi:NAD(P)-dependent oxidoreductase [Microbaculum sp. FT89]|uniref:NAD(P)-dependent oxidoreductase n=1 Tax=Microbaculum sp. FT89 TaxID=3447298 RepID=UPI003F53230B